MSLDRFFKGSAMDVMASAGTIGLHMVSGPMVGFGIGYALDAWLGTSPWCKLAFFLVGVVAGFMNVYEDTQRLLRKIQREDMARRGLGPNGERLTELGGDKARMMATSGAPPADTAGAPGATGGFDAAHMPDVADAVAAARRTLGAGAIDAAPVDDDDSLEAVLKAEMEDLQRELTTARKGSAEGTMGTDPARPIDQARPIDPARPIEPARLVNTTRSRLQ